MNSTSAPSAIPMRRPMPCDENAIVGTVVGVTATATDADAHRHGHLHPRRRCRRAVCDRRQYGCGDRGRRHRLGGETATSHNITVRATSSDGSTTDQGFTITVNDRGRVRRTGAVTDADAAANTVAEDAIVGTTVGVTAWPATPMPPTSVTYSLDDDAGGRFTIDANTGVVTVSRRPWITKRPPATTSRSGPPATDGSFATQTFHDQRDRRERDRRHGDQRHRCGGRFRAGERRHRHGGRA